MQRSGFWRATLAGIAAWVVFIVVLHVLPLLEVPMLDLSTMLGGLFGLNSVAAGWAILFVAGMVFVFLYAFWWLNRLPGPGWQRGPSPTFVNHHSL